MTPREQSRVAREDLELSQMTVEEARHYATALSFGGDLIERPTVDQDVAVILNAELDRLDPVVAAAREWRTWRHNCQVRQLHTNSGGTPEVNRLIDALERIKEEK